MADAALVLAPEPVGSPDAHALRAAYAAEVSAVLGLHFVAEAGGDADLAPPTGEFWVARLDGAPVGCLGARTLDDGAVELKRLYVAPAARGHRAGQRLMAAAEEWARGRGAGRLLLDTRPELEAACRLYRRTGWVEVEPYNDNDHAGLWFAKQLERPVGGLG